MNLLQETANKDLAILGLDATCIKVVDSPLSYTLYINLNDINDYNPKHLKRVVEKWGVGTHLDMRFEETKEAHFKVVVNKPRQPLPLETLLGNDLTIGVDDDGNKVNLDFEKNPHLLIAGATGSGKSVLLHNIIFNLFYQYGNSKKQIDFFIIDPKGNELSDYKNTIHTCYIDDTKQAINILKRLCEEMDARYKGTSKYEPSDIYIIIDELADLMLTSKYEVEESIVRLAQKGRACNMHLIVATQRPTTDVCTGLIKANMPVRIALKTASIRDSMVILDHKGSESLLGYGDAILKNGIFEKHFLVAYLNKETEKRMVELNKKG